jgi:hypothetical protein
MQKGRILREMGDDSETHHICSESHYQGSETHCLNVRED